MKRQTKRLALMTAPIALTIPAFTGCDAATNQTTNPTAEHVVTAEAVEPNIAPDNAENLGRVTWETRLAETAEFLGIENPPEVQVVREISPEEADTLIGACMTEAGFPSDPNYPHQLSWAVSEDQQEPHALAWYTCTARYPIKEDYLQPITDSQWLFIRQYWIDETIPCFAELGIDAPAPPSEEVFLEQQRAMYAAGQAGVVFEGDMYQPDISAGLWDMGLSHEEIYRILENCPVNPSQSVVIQH